MKIILLSLISILLVNCGGGKNTDQWKAPNIYYLRSDGNKNTVLTNNDILQLNDYVYFSASQTQVPDLEEMKNTKSEFTIKAQAKCVSDGKSFAAENSYKKNHIQIKELIPIEASLYNQEMTTCKISLQLKNSKGSTKTFALPERNIDVKNFSADLEIKAVIETKELEFTQILNLQNNELITLVCDSFSVQMKNPGVNSLSLEQLTSRVKKAAQDITVQQYKPNQYCRVTINKENEKMISNKFQIKFDKLIPKYSLKGNIPPENHRFNAYRLTLENLNSVPVSVALNKAALKNVALVRQVHVNTGRFLMPIRANLKLRFSDNTKVIEKGNVFVIHLNPGESLSAATFIDEGKNIKVDKQHPIPKPIYNLEYNYRSIAEIESASNVKISESLNVN